ncbi:MAG TPA: AhpC/TSA family protein [Chitinophagaceae bacterium]|nr:AhpC/TSA family protein [Chitinophagaceae bacterium]
MKALITVIVGFALPGCMIAQTNGFKLTGTVTGFADSTLLYLDDLSDGSFRHIDSVYIIGGKFSFTGRLSASPLRAAVRLKDINYRCYVWLENTSMHFTGDKQKFRESVLTGSRTQQEQAEFDAFVKAANNRREAEFLFVRDNPGSIISASVLSVYSSSWGKDTSAMLYKGFTDEVKNSIYGKRVSEYISLVRNIQVGDVFVDFSQEDTKGRLRKLSELKGKVVLLEFWGSWCGPCRKGNPGLVKIYNEFKSGGFEVFGVGAETKKSEWLEAVEDDKLPWINVSDLRGDNNKAALMYNVSYYPANFLIDRNGLIVAKDLHGEALRAKLMELLGR